MRQYCLHKNNACVVGSRRGGELRPNLRAQLRATVSHAGSECSERSSDAPAGSAAAASRTCALPRTALRRAPIRSHAVGTIPRLKHTHRVHLLAQGVTRGVRTHTVHVRWAGAFPCGTLGHTAHHCRTLCARALSRNTHTVRLRTALIAVRPAPHAVNWCWSRR